MYKLLIAFISLFTMIVFTACDDLESEKTKDIAAINSVINCLDVHVSAEMCTHYNYSLVNWGRFRNFIAVFSISDAQYNDLCKSGIKSLAEERKQFHLVDDDSFILWMESVCLTSKWQCDCGGLSGKVREALVTRLHVQNTLKATVGPEDVLVSLPQSKGTINRVFLVYNHRTLTFVATLWEQSFWDDRTKNSVLDHTDVNRNSTSKNVLRDDAVTGISK